MVGLALDLPKSYDRLPLALLRKVAWWAGVPPVVAGPTRLLRCWPCGFVLRPVCGLTTGCPAATHLLALVAMYWAGYVRHLGASPCDYVDNLVARFRWRSGEPWACVAARMVCVLELCGCVRGAVVACQSREGHLAADRVAGAAEWLRRCGSLAAGFAQSKRVILAAGMPPSIALGAVQGSEALCGMSCGRPSLRPKPTAGCLLVLGVRTLARGLLRFRGVSRMLRKRRVGARLLPASCPVGL